jgi:TonB family protein
MKRALFATAIVIAAFCVVQAQAETTIESSAPLTAQQAEAQRELNLAEVAYEGNRYTAARRHAELASVLNPANRDGLIIIARSIRALYRDDDESPANFVRAREAIAAFLQVSIDPDNDEIYSEVRDLYGAIAEEELQYSWMMQRATCYSLPANKRVDAYLDLALLDLNRSKRISDEVAEKLYDRELEVENLEGLNVATRSELAKGREIASRGIQMVHQAIMLNPENEVAPARKAELLLSIARKYELEGNDVQAQQCKATAQYIVVQAAKQKAKREEAAFARMVTVECDDLCDNLIYAPRPTYPPIARAARASGSVVIQVLIDKEGNVISATAIDGHPLLRAAALDAARRSTYRPILVSGQPIMTSGSLTYNFTLE